MAARHGSFHILSITDRQAGGFHVFADRQGGGRPQLAAAAAAAAVACKVRDSSSLA